MKVMFTEEEFDSIVRTMTRLLVMYEKKREDGCRVYIVLARLPEYGDESVLDKIDVNERMMKTTWTFRRSYPPPGIIGRFLAYCVNNIKDAGECWQHGARLYWGKGHHDVLVYENFVQKRHTTGTRTFSCLTICVKGISNEVRSILEEVKDSLRSLISDDMLGYPGIQSPTFAETKTIKSGELDDLRVYLDNRFDRLHGTMKKIAENSSRLIRTAFATFAPLDELKYPRLVLLKPESDVNSSRDAAVLGSKGGDVSEEERRHAARGVHLQRETWDRWIQAWRSRNRKFRLVFLCEYDLSEVPCGEDGKGYPIQDVSKFLKDCLLLLKVRYAWISSRIYILLTDSHYDVDDLGLCLRTN